MKQYFVLPVVLACCFHEAAHAAEDFSSYVQVRYRYEYDDNFSVKFYGEHPKKGEADDGFLLQRLRAGFTCRLSENFLLSAGVQDARVYDPGLPDEVFYDAVWGHQNSPFEDYMEPYNTYLQFENVFGSKLQIKAGRQVFSYGDYRILGPAEWGNSVMYLWDAVVISYKKDKDFMDFFWGAHVLHDPERISWSHGHSFYGAGVYSHFEFLRGVKVEPFLIFKYEDHETFMGESGVGDYFSSFPGIRVAGSLPWNFFYDFTWVWQSGEYGADDVEAWGAQGQFGKRFPAVFLTPAPSVQYSYASGDGNSHDGVRKRFEGVFGARDRVYGRMNLFNWSNLKDLQLNLDFDPFKSVHVKAEFHRFWLAEAKDGWSLNSKEYRDPTGMSGDEVGDEFDVVITWMMDELLPEQYGGIELQGGYSHFTPGGFTEKVADDCEANWYFAQITYNLAF